MLRKRKEIPPTPEDSITYKSFDMKKMNKSHISSPKQMFINFLEEKNAFNDKVKTKIWLTI